MKKLMLISGFLLFARVASAQAPTSYNLKIFNQGAPSPFTTANLPAVGFTCGVTPKATTSGTATNPSKVYFDDPAAPATADCVYTDPGTGPLFALPFGIQVYTATLNAVNTAGTSADSTSSNPFSRPGTVVSALTGLRVK